MFIKTTGDDFDKLIEAAKRKHNLNSASNLKIHRNNSRVGAHEFSSSDGARLGEPVSVNFPTFFERAGAPQNAPREGAHHSNERNEPDLHSKPAPGLNPHPGNKIPESLGDKRWKYQGKTYKEEPIGRS